MCGITLHSSNDYNESSIGNCPGTISWIVSTPFPMKILNSVYKENKHLIGLKKPVKNKAHILVFVILKKNVDINSERTLKKKYKVFFFFFKVRGHKATRYLWYRDRSKIYLKWTVKADINLNWSWNFRVQTQLKILSTLTNILRDKSRTHTFLHNNPKLMDDFTLVDIHYIFSIIQCIIIHYQSTQPMYRIIYWHFQLSLSAITIRINFEAK